MVCCWGRVCEKSYCYMWVEHSASRTVLLRWVGLPKNFISQDILVIVITSVRPNILRLVLSTSFHVSLGFAIPQLPSAFSDWDFFIQLSFICFTCPSQCNLLSCMLYLIPVMSNFSQHICIPL